MFFFFDFLLFRSRLMESLREEDVFVAVRKNCHSVQAKEGGCKQAKRCRLAAPDCE